MRFAGGIIPQRGRICKTFPQKNFPSARRRHARREDSRQAVKKVPSSRHVRMDGTPTGKFGAESVRAALRRVRGSAPNFVPRGIPGGRNFCPAYAGRNGFPLERVAFATRCKTAPSSVDTVEGAVLSFQGPGRLTSCRCGGAGRRCRGGSARPGSGAGRTPGTRGSSGCGSRSSS